MSLSAPFIRRPVATTLLSLGLVVAGVIAFFKLPVSPLPDVDIPTISVQATLPGASPADVADDGRKPARAPPWPDRRCHRNDVGELAGLRPHQSAIRHRSRHQRRRARRAGGHQCGARRPADQSAEQSDLPQIQSRLGADPDLHLDVGYADAGRALRRRLDGARPEAVADRRRRRSRRQRRIAARRARRADPAGALQIRHWPGGCSRRARQRQCPQPEGRHRRREPALPDLFQRSGQQGRGLQVADRRLSQRRAGAPDRCRRRRRFRGKRAHARPLQRQAGGHDDRVPAAGRQHHPDGRPREGADAAIAGLGLARHRPQSRGRSLEDDPGLAARRRDHACSSPSPW